MLLKYLTKIKNLRLSLPYPDKMCFTATASFAMAGLLYSGGIACLHENLKMNRKYTAMAIMPIAVGMQQFMEGLSWHGLTNGNPGLLARASLAYMFFVWVFWPSWIPFMTATLENNIRKKRILYKVSMSGFIFGACLYLPYFWHPDWQKATAIHYSLAYTIPDFFLPLWTILPVYLTFIGIPPIMSSHFHVRLFGISLIMFVPLTYLLFSYACISVLCFFAAIMTVDLIFIIAGDKCRLTTASPYHERKISSWI